MDIKAAENIARIQKCFMATGEDFLKPSAWNERIALLEAEAPEFRSIAYESASMAVALLDLPDDTTLRNWHYFYSIAGKPHAFHMGIGLGWAFAKAEIWPETFLGAEHPVLRNLIYDGIGYYHALYRGRRTIKSQLLPEGLTRADLLAFDSGIGRRLWYMAQGNLELLKGYLYAFEESRQNGLWHGVGIACAYAGGADTEMLNAIQAAAGYRKNWLSRGIALSALSRILSGNLTDDIALACNVLLQKPLEGLAADLPVFEDPLSSTLSEQWQALCSGSDEAGRKKSGLTGLVNTI